MIVAPVSEVPPPIDRHSARSETALRQARAIVALPAYNEEQAIAPLLEGLTAAFARASIHCHIFVVNDGSTDNTAGVVNELSRQLPVTLVQHEKNQGLAGALRTAFNTANKAAHANDVIITLDADNTQPASLAPRLFNMILEGHDVAIASRFQRGSRVVGVPFTREWLSIGARALFTLLFPIRGVRDYTCGFRAYRAAVLRSALADYGDSFVSERGFSCMVDVLLKLRGRGLIMGEAPMVLRYDWKPGESKMNVARTIRQTLSLVVRRRLSR